MYVLIHFANIILTHSIGKFISGVKYMSEFFNVIIKYVKKSYKLKRCHKCEPGSKGSFHHSCPQTRKMILHEGEQQECLSECLSVNTVIKS